ncbi:hypothetical protein H0S70_06955 [Chryseobacterium manosquense]|uniref:Uncharacterized protein n=1 Tax=Chryseobacterium manosquense TaxID=2754694 RepID=A0A7H1DT38_9FLAO|nr:hypothetical protein [Chryseobacterium manosquense]QNS40146.1 hypothetical protein H0S70_06955 [Chryseobacterium manosquense]
MKKQIAEVQKYFIDKITACQFNVTEIKDTNDGWFTLNVEIDGFTFNFSVKPKSQLCTDTFGFMDIKIPNDRLQNLINLIEAHKEKIKSEKIEKLKSELSELEKELS